MLSLILSSLSIGYSIYLHSKVQRVSNEIINIKTQTGSMRYDFTREANAIADSLQSVKDRQKGYEDSLHSILSNQKSNEESIEVLFEKFKDKAIVKKENKKH